MAVFPSQPVLIIGGSGEARVLAARLSGQSAVMLPAPERVKMTWPVPVAPMFLTKSALNARLDHGVRVVVDASHPCDVEASRIACVVARDRGLPMVRLERAEWRPGRRDHWVFPRNEEAVGGLISPGERVLLATGRQSLPRLKGLAHAYVYARQITPHEDRFPLPRGRFLRGRSPFSVPEEVGNLRRLRIDWIVLRNAGGMGGWPKLAAARKLGVRVAMLPRPDLPDAPVTRDIAETLRWLAPWL